MGKSSKKAKKQKAEVDEYSSLIELSLHIAAPILFLNSESLEVYFANEVAADLLGYTTQELCGKPIIELMDPTNSRRIYAMFDLVKLNGNSSKFKEQDVFLKRKSKRLIPTNLAVSKMQFTNGGKFHELITLTIEDLTEIKKISGERQQILEESFRISKLADLGRLAAGVAHEINNPLGIILGQAEVIESLLESDKIVPEKIRESIGPIINAVTRASRITRTMVAMSRSGSDIGFVYVDMKKVFQEPLQFLQTELDRNQVEIINDLDDVQILCEPYRIEQIIINILNNAMYALSKREPDFKKQIKISVRFVEDSLFVEIWNNGIPIDEGIKPKLLQPFETNKPVGEGTGLGLYLSHEIMMAHEGKLQFYSSEKQGTAFQLVFPISRWIKSNSRIRKYALVVDDDDVFRMTMVQRIQRFGFSVFEASSGKKALEVLRSHPEITCVFMDYQMDEMNGISLAQKIKNRDSSIELVLVSGYLQDPDVQKFIRKGLLNYSLQKPVSQMDLEQFFDICLSKKAA